MAVTLKQIAQMTGLSIPTVSDVLNKKGELYKPETRQRVLDAARSLGYHPNAAARAMTTGRFGTVALLLSTKPHFSYLPTELLEGIHDALAERELNLMLSKLPDEKLVSEDFVPTVLKQWMVDGLLINYINELPEPLARTLHQFRLPSVYINIKREFDSVYVDDLAGARVATQRLIDLGHRSIAYLHLSQTELEATSLGHYSARDRHAGFAHAMRSAGLAPRALFGGPQLPFCEWSARIAVELKQSDRPTAVLTYGNGEASAVLAAARLAGLSVPRDLSVITFANAPMVEPDLALATMVLPWREIGSAGVTALLNKIATKTVNVPSQALTAALCGADSLSKARTRIKC